MIEDVRLLILMLSILGTAQAEIRGVWVDRSSLVTRAEIRATMQRLAAANFNVAFVNVWSRGYPLWRSQVFERETGIAGDPGFVRPDVMQDVAEEARDAGIALMGWAEYGFVGGWSGYFPGEGKRGPIFDRHPDWLARTRTGEPAFPAPGGSFYWMAHARPDVRAFLLDLMAELVAQYDIAGLQFDRARYPQLDCGYDDYTVELYRQEHDGASPPDDPADAEWVGWRAAGLNDFVRDLQARLKSVDWRTLTSNAPGPYPSSYNSFVQDYPAWMRQRSLDFVVPQLYRSDAGSFSRELARQIAQLEDTSRLVPGLDGTNPSLETLIRQIEIVRERGLPGVVIWYYRGLLDKGGFEKLKASVFSEQSELPWKNR